MRAAVLDRVILAVLAIVLGVIGAASAVAPAAFYDGFDIRVDGIPALASELRATGVALFLLSLAIAAGAVWTRWAFVSAVIGALVATGYAAGRGISSLVDGAPGPAMAAAALIEFVLAVAAVLVVVRTRPRG